MTEQPNSTTNTSALRRYLSREDDAFPNQSWLFTFSHAAWTAELKSVQEGNSTHVCWTDGDACASYDGCLASFAHALTFPEYYGGNSDAFIECLDDLLTLTETSFLGAEFGDRTGIDKESVLLVVDPGETFLSEATESERDKLFRIIDYGIGDQDAVWSPEDDPTTWKAHFAVAIITNADASRTAI